MSARRRIPVVYTAMRYNAQSVCDPVHAAMSASNRREPDAPPSITTAPGNLDRTKCMPIVGPRGYVQRSSRR